MLDKINTHHTYLDVTNYWAPLEKIEEEDDTEEEQINNIVENTLEAPTKSGNKWTRRLEKRQKKQNEHKIIFDSGATSHFMSDDMYLPNIGQSNKEV